MSAAKRVLRLVQQMNLRKKFKNWNPEVAIYQIKNTSDHKNLHYLRIRK